MPGRINVVVASPTDVREEREAVTRVCHRWNEAHESPFVHATGYEFAAPELGAHPQTILNERLIDRGDLLVAIFWTRLGQPTPSAPSGTVEEIREFIARKGPRRVMLYFSTRDVPWDHNAAELARLRDFKEEMRSQGLYFEYRVVEQFEREFSNHLAEKIQKLIAGMLDEPGFPTRGLSITATVPADPRMAAEPTDYGGTFGEIATRFAARMDAFDAIGGSTPAKYLALAAHVYTMVAESLDRVLVYSQTMLPVHRAAIQDISYRLKRLSDYEPFRDRAFPDYWKEGRAVANDLLAQIAHVRRMGQV